MAKQKNKRVELSSEAESHRVTIKCRSEKSSNQLEMQQNYLSQHRKSNNSIFYKKDVNILNVTIL